MVDAFFVPLPLPASFVLFFSPSLPSSGVGFGGLGVGVALGVAQLQGILQVCLSLIGIMNGPILGLFVASVFLPFVNSLVRTEARQFAVLCHQEKGLGLPSAADHNFTIPSHCNVDCCHDGKRKLNDTDRIERK